MDRRKFLGTAAIGGAALALQAQEQKKKDGKVAESKTEAPAQTGSYKKPVIISAANGFNSVDTGYEILRSGGDTLDACIAVGMGPENDPNDSSVGLGGLPNEDGVVELDACGMHGPTRRAAAVGAVHWTKNPSKLVKGVMEHTGHVMIVGAGADRVAQVLGFPKDELLTERSRMTWQLWKEYHSYADWWGPGLWDPNYKVPKTTEPSTDIYRSVVRLDDLAAEIGIPPEFRAEAIRHVLFPPTGTIHISSLKENGEMSGLTTTSGLAWKLAGRLGDSPIIGAGSYTDQDIGSAGATGSGEENIRVAGAHSIVENMRRGMSPQDAGLDVLKRIVRNYNNDMEKLKYVSMTFYILRKDGAYAGVSLWSGPAQRPTRFCVHDGEKRLQNTVPLMQGVGTEYPPIPDMLQQKWREMRQRKQ